MWTDSLTSLTTPIERFLTLVVFSFCFAYMVFRGNVRSIHAFLVLSCTMLSASLYLINPHLPSSYSHYLYIASLAIYPFFHLTDARTLCIYILFFVSHLILSAIAVRGVLIFGIRNIQHHSTSTARSTILSALRLKYMA